MRCLLPLMVVVLALGAKAQLAGGISQVFGDLNPDQGDIVRFAFSQLAGSSGNCKRRIVRVENFSQQVVAGTLFRFDLVLGDDASNAPGCPYTDSNAGSCSIVVWEKVWENFREVQWEDSSCQQDNQEDPENIPIAGGITQVDSNKLSAEHQGIATYGFEQLTQLTARPGGCTKRLLRVENFGEQVVAGTLYHFDLVLQCGNNVEPSCSMKVLDVPWEGGKSVLWDQSTCDDNNGADNSFDDNRQAPGGIEQVDSNNLSAEHQGIANYGLEQLTQLTARPGGCTKRLLRVENFGVQTVAGTLYHFDLVLQCGNNVEPSCSMKVLDVPWEGGKSVLWDQSTCDENDGADISFDDNRQKPGGIEQVSGPGGILSDAHQEIVSFGFTKLRERTAKPGDCQETLRRVRNFESQVVAGTLYHFDFVLQCGSDPEFTCSMKVLDVPWEGGKSVLWDRSDCDELA